ncbi:MAG TPA: acyl-CoA dehydrogenase family protein [Lentisphaeria bacterium]|nr:acyl-CoA dehydrogenase family protein [Lentisphaeria bacterium]
MADNFYLDNHDLAFHLKTPVVAELSRLRENDFKDAGTRPDAPVDENAALALYERWLAKVGELSAQKIAPRAAAVDREGVALQQNDVVFAPGTQENLRELVEAGLMGVMLPRRYGGLNLPVTVYSMMTEMVSRADASLQNLFGLQDIAETILLFGSDEQKARFLPRFASGELDGAMALTEPDAGSDLQSVQLAARYDEASGKWLLNGKKHFITNGCAKVLLVLARSEEGSKDGRGLSLFLAEKSPQITVPRLEDKLGIHGSPTCELQFNDAPAELIGQRRRGLTRYVMSLMNGARLAISSQAVGVAEAARRCAWDYTSKRSQFGKPLCDIPAVWEMLSRMDVLTAAGRTLLYETSACVDKRDALTQLNEAGAGNDDTRNAEKAYGRLADLLTPMTKFFTTEMANQVAYDAIQCHGGKGYMRELNAERYYRDARIMNIYEGTTQMQVVAAIGGVMKQLLAPVMDELAALPFGEGLRPLAARIAAARRLSQECLEMLNADDHGKLDLLARRMVRMESLIFVSLLLLRDAQRAPARRALAERFIWEFLPEVAMQATIVKTALS